MEAHIWFLTFVLTICLFLATCPKSHCKEDELKFPPIRVGSQTFNVIGIDPPAYTMSMVRTDLVYDNCKSNMTNTSLSTPLNLFRYTPNVKNVTLFYGCPQNISIGRNNFPCHPVPDFNSDNPVFYAEENDGLLQQLSELHNCERRIQVPVSKDTFLDPQDGIEALEALYKGFEVLYTADGPCGKCVESKGICGSNDSSHFTCYCLDGAHAHDCSDSSRRRIIRKVIVGFTIGATGALLICITIFCCKIKSLRQKIGYWKTSKVDQNIEAFISNHGPLALTRYKFANVKKMTNSFEVKLGQGGYGAVYKGKLLNGCLVAVKILKPSKGNGEEFINEVASICRTSHVNVVTLLGFCLEGRKKALIYEFMANGSLEKFIPNKANKTSPSLTWENLNQIAIGIARGLEYLHRGCNTRILHFDIKPHNILLDENFCPKISDFGLAKLCPGKESIISISEARGTMGYLAPEVWNRNIGGVSHKSDVYSYGMMLLDIVGGRKNMNIEANCTTEIYFPDWIYDKLEQGSDLGHHGVNTMEENDIAKRITIVGLWCTQTFPTQRPTISGVIDMLEESLDSLEIPPKPIMFSPTRLELESSTTTNTMTY